MNFGKNLLEKYGWKEGQGLGKSEDGISVPLRANLKFDQAGLGHNKADELNNRWWERVFNSAAQNVDVNKNENDDVSMKLKTGKSIEISTKSYSIDNQSAKTPYNSSFLKTSTLTSMGTEEQHPDKDVFAATTNEIKILSDEDLFSACNGRTAHKGARHGLNLKGKLDRIEAQEKQLMEKFNSSLEQKTPGNIFNDWIDVQNRKNTKKSKTFSVSSTPETESIPSAEILYKNEYVAKSFKQQKKQKRLDNHLSLAFDINFDDSATPKKKKSLGEKLKPSKKLIDKVTTLSNNRYSLLDTSSTTIKKKKNKNCTDSNGKRKKKLKNLFFESEFDKNELTNDCDEITVLPKIGKKSKKKISRKRRFLVDDVDVDDEQNDSGCSSTICKPATETITDENSLENSLESFGLPTKFGSEKKSKLKCKKKWKKAKEKTKEWIEDKKMKRLAKELQKKISFASENDSSPKEKIL